MTRSMVDVLAEKVGKLGDCTVTVIRVPHSDAAKLGKPRLNMYHLNVKRGDYSMTFGPMLNHHARMTLAMIADCLNLGLITDRYRT